ncbi:unnamed protein product [Schistocephalus solidus]|uniref:Histidine kinase n=1 Tax=Schistocephalus solidus TaxID=70667 RepID=A0A183SP43_SCHSO|nr:unnamed protein product [Schistocephalus solidus]
MAQFRDTGDRLGVIQKGIPPLIQGWREILRADSISVLEGDEALFNNLTRVNDELLLGIQNYQQATEKLHLPHDETKPYLGEDEAMIDLSVGTWDHQHVLFVSPPDETITHQLTVPRMGVLQVAFFQIRH